MSDSGDSGDSDDYRRMDPMYEYGKEFIIELDTENSNQGQQMDSLANKYGRGKAGSPIPEAGKMGNIYYNNRNILYKGNMINVGTEAAENYVPHTGPNTKEILYHKEYFNGHQKTMYKGTIIKGVRDGKGTEFHINGVRKFKGNYIEDKIQSGEVHNSVKILNDQLSFENWMEEEFYYTKRNCLDKYKMRCKNVGMLDVLGDVVLKVTKMNFEAYNEKSGHFSLTLFSQDNSSEYLQFKLDIGQSKHDSEHKTITYKKLKTLRRFTMVQLNQCLNYPYAIVKNIKPNGKNHENFIDNQILILYPKNWNTDNSIYLEILSSKRRNTFEHKIGSKVRDWTIYWPTPLASLKPEQSTLELDEHHKALNIEEYLVSHIFWQNGNLMYNGLVIKGSYQGLGKLYHKNGQLEYKGMFINGKKNMLVGKIYWPNGVLRYHGELRNDGYHGKKSLEFHEDGSLKYMGKFKDGIHDTNAKIYHMKTEPSIFTGEAIYQNDNLLGLDKGPTMYEGNMKNGVFGPVGTLYHRNGLIKYQGKFHDGGPSQNNNPIYHSDGKTIEYQGDFKNGKRHGKGNLLKNNNLQVHYFGRMVN